MTRRQLSGILLGQITATATSFGKVEDADRGAICWEADNGTSRIYLLGTLHALRAEHPMPRFVDRLYQRASSVFLEFNPFEQSLDASKKTALKYGLLPARASLLDYLSARQQAQLRKFLLPRPELAGLVRQKPWLAAMTLQNTLAEEAGFLTIHGVETYYSHKCVHDRKPLRLLEKVETPIRALSALPMDVQTRFFVEALQLTEGNIYASSVERLYNAWRAEDHIAIMVCMSTEPMMPEIHDCIISQRNKAWAETLAKAKDLHNSIICTGIQHVNGKGNLAFMTQEMGFKIRRFRA